MPQSPRTSPLVNRKLTWHRLLRSGIWNREWNLWLGGRFSFNQNFQNFETAANGREISRKVFRNSGNCLISEMRTIQWKILEIPGAKLNDKKTSAKIVFENLGIPREVALYFGNFGKCCSYFLVERKVLSSPSDNRLLAFAKVHWHVNSRFLIILVTNFPALSNWNFPQVTGFVASHGHGVFDGHHVLR